MSGEVCKTLKISATCILFGALLGQVFWAFHITPILNLEVMNASGKALRYELTSHRPQGPVVFAGKQMQVHEQHNLWYVDGRFPHSIRVFVGSEILQLDCAAVPGLQTIVIRQHLHESTCEPRSIMRKAAVQARLTARSLQQSLARL